MTLEEAFTKGWKAGASDSNSTRDESDAAFAHDLKQFMKNAPKDRSITLTELSHIIDNACTCGGGATGASDDTRCPACEVWKILTK